MLPSATDNGYLPTDDHAEVDIMAQKTILIADPGIDTAFAIALALHDPMIDVIGLIASAGNVSADQATQNIHILVNQIDVPKWPRIGAALPVNYEIGRHQAARPGRPRRRFVSADFVASADAGRQTDRGIGAGQSERSHDRRYRAHARCWRVPSIAIRICRT